MPAGKSGRGSPLLDLLVLAHQPRSRLLLIGIANDLNLVHRIMPLVQASLPSPLGPLFARKSCYCYCMLMYLLGRTSGQHCAGVSLVCAHTLTWVLGGTARVLASRGLPAVRTTASCLVTMPYMGAAHNSSTPGPVLPHPRNLHTLHTAPSDTSSLLSCCAGACGRASGHEDAPCALRPL